MIPVVDVFAGPGGLNEGFAHFRHSGEHLFEIVASFEMEKHAVDTLVTRSALRSLANRADGSLYGRYRDLLAGRIGYEQLRMDAGFANALELAKDHVHHIELGPANRESVAARIRSAISASGDWVLIGGPPCQAYSLVGRARRTKDENFADDKKHFLYREYLDILKRFTPAIFVMENVKGLLSAGHGGQSMMQRILEDLRLGGKYSVRSLVVEGDDPDPKDFVIRAEDYGVPQRRHRVILLGVRNDLDDALATPLERSREEATVSHAIGGMPTVKARVSRTKEPEIAWTRARELGRSLAERELGSVPSLQQTKTNNDELRRWLTANQPPISLHESRAHMEADLARYAYLATLAAQGFAPRVAELPPELKPEHKNLDVAGTPFTDRFKVQAWARPSSTVVSHISKDGHYFIHPDPNQMRSLTVREAARLQTFPDDYWFCGPRTMQFHQVGNAVPPFLAVQIAGKVAKILGH